MRPSCGPPLAGLGAVELDSEHRLSMLPLADPAPPPASFASAAAAGAVSEGVARCRDEVHSVLEAYGVPPAELLAPPNPTGETSVPAEPPPEISKKPGRGGRSIRQIASVATVPTPSRADSPRTCGTGSGV